MSIKVIVRDGRAGRDPALITDEGGEVLAEFEVERPYTEGDRLTLPDGTEVIVIGGRDRIIPNKAWTQIVHIGNV